MLAAFDWHTSGTGSSQVDSAFAPALFATIYIAVIAQVLGVVLGLMAALDAHVAPAGAPGALGLLRLGVPRDAGDRADLLRLLRRNILFGVTMIPNSLGFGAFTLGGAVVRRHPRARVQRGCLHAGDHPRRDRLGRQRAARSGAVARDEHGLAMRRIVLPQAARVIVPPLGNEFNNMLKTTSLLFFIGVVELWRNAEIGYSQTFKPVEYFAAVAVWYLLLTTIWTLHPVADRAAARGQRARRVGVHAGRAAARRVLAPPTGARVTDLVVRAVDVEKRFGRLEVLKGVSLEVAQARDDLHHRPIRLGQDDVHPLHQPPREDRRGPDRGERAPDRLPRAATGGSSRTASGRSRGSARRSAWCSSGSTSSRTRRRSRT